MADKFQKRIAIKIASPEPVLSPEIPSVPDAHAIAISTQAQLGTDIPDAPTQNVVTLGRPDAVLGYDFPNAPDANVLALEARALLSSDIADAPEMRRVQTPVISPELSGELSDAPSSVTSVVLPPLPELRVDIPDTPSSAVIVNLPPLPDISNELASASDTARVQIPAVSPELKVDISDAPSAMTSVMLPVLPELSSVVSDTPDAVKITTAPPLPVLSPELADAPSASITVLSPQLPVLSPELPDAPEMRRVQTPTKSPELSPEISDAPTAQVIRPAIPLPELSPEISDAPEMRRVQIPTPSPELKVELSDAPTKEVIRLAPPAPAFPSIDSIPDPGEIGQEKAREFSFNGAWHPSEDPLNIQPQDYAVQKNFRNTNDGIEGVGGFSYINAIPMGKQIRSAIPLKTNYSSQPSVILAQGVDSAGTNGVIATNESTIPGTGNFDFTAFVIAPGSTRIDFLISNGTSSGTATILLTAETYNTGAELAAYLESIMNTNLTIVTLIGAVVSVAYSTTAYTFTIDVSAPPNTIQYVDATSTAGATFGFTADDGPSWAIIGDPLTNTTGLYAESTGHGLARFSHLPQGNIGMCDGKANQIYAGDEMPVGAFMYGAEKTVVIAGSNDNLQFTSGTPETAIITITGGTYTGVTLAAEIQTRIREAALTLPAATVEFRLGKFFFDAGSGKTILFTGTGDGAYGVGLIAATTAARTMLSQAPWVNSPHFQGLLDETNIINNDLTTTGNTVTIASATTYNYFLIGATRPLQGLKITTTSGNFTTATLSGTYFNGEKMATLASLAVATSGSVDTVTFTDTSSTAKPIFINGYYLYFYRFELSAGSSSITVSNVTCKANIQSPCDLWDGLFRTATKFIYKKYANSKYSDFNFTLEAAESSAVTTREYVYSSSATETKAGLIPIGADVGGASNGLNEADEDYIEVMFSEPISVFKWDLYKTEYGGDVNSMTVSFWDGDSYVPAQNVYDTTKNDVGGTANYYMLERGGIQFFEIPLYNADMTAYTTIERASEINGVKGYRYKISWTYEAGQQRFLHMILDTFTGIPRYRNLDEVYTFPFQYRNRAMWCGCISDSELNRVDYSQQNAPDVYNGDDSSKYDNSQSLKFGDKTALTGAVELFNQYGLNLASGALFFKNTQTFLLTGSTPTGDDAFKINKVSGQIGCPAPLTITPCEVSFTTGDQPPANVVLWMTDKGPVMYYNASIYEIPGVEYFFRQENTTACLDLTYVDRAAAWYDSEYREWNLVFPSDAAVTNMDAAGLCDTWIVFDLVRKKWYQRVTANWDDFPQGGFQVEDTAGNKYVYTYTASGYLMRMENGLTDGDGSTGIVNTVKTADILPLQSMWAKTYVRRMKVLHVANAAGSLAITHYADGDPDSDCTVQAVAAENMIASGNNRYVNLIKQVYGSSNQLLTGLTHCFQFSVTLATAVKPKLLGWSAQFLFDRPDEV